jgi:hypothetical protein
MYITGRQDMEVEIDGKKYSIYIFPSIKGDGTIGYKIYGFAVCGGFKTEVSAIDAAVRKIIKLKNEKPFK